MPDISVLSWNVCGLNSANKRTRCLDYLHRKHIDLVFVQEAHLTPSTVSKFANRYYYTAASSLGDSQSKGSLIVLRRRLSLNILGKESLMEGRVAILKTIISGCKIAFVSVYAPSTFDPMFFPNLTRELLELSEYKLVMGMDANAVIEAANDRSSRREVGSQKHASLALKRFMSDLSLIDLYRFFKPNS